MIALIAWAWPYLAAAGAALLAAFGLYAKGRADASARARLKSLEDDHEAAADLRRIVDRGLADRVRKFDDAGFRD
ncbi:hypothetical protein [Pseudogemmobacter faecipullorum]|uniref:ABC transporter permease n=1 Tax=Pseudogemmobacter faecipullorum TaxID=2755041 RepID=A0ABS8CQ69_9RHOB|nr:hypothetical protein [Pseudogemmobacter faecipullorum]MCB5411330.1 hypothetical protein [Pseudogemmobacter faecipullorum]